MIKKLKQWWIDRKARKSYLLYLAGYDYAAGKLLRNGLEAVEDLGAEIQGFNFNEFDEGVVDALNEFRLQLQINKNAATPKKQMEHELEVLKKHSLGTLTPFEIQSGSTRLNHAEVLILQLPITRDGRNTWLMNYGVL